MNNALDRLRSFVFGTNGDKISRTGIKTCGAVLLVEMIVKLIW